MSSRYGIKIHAKSTTDSLDGQMVQLNPSGALYSDCKQWVEEARQQKEAEFGGGFYSFELVEEA